MDVNDFLGYQVGDIVTLKDIQTQMDMDELANDLVIQEIRQYREPNGFFTYYGYIMCAEKEGEESQDLLLLVRTMGKDFDLQVYFLDVQGDACNFDVLFKEDMDDLADQFECDLHFDDADLHVNWQKKDDGTTFGVETTSSDVGDDQKTLAEYHTDDDTRGNPYAFVEWTGNKEDGFIELWFGCDIKPEDVELHHT